MVRAKKHLGQHFLIDENIARKIIDSLPGETKNLLEVGAGTGVLTKYLLDNPRLNLLIIDVDEESIAYLKHKYPEASQHIVHGDFLEANLETIFSGAFSVIGNFPYNISSQIFFKLLQHRNQVETIVGMIQKEVAERIASPPGSKVYGILSVLLQAYFDIEHLFNVSANVFSPPPNVKSSVIRLKRNETTELPCSEELFFRVIKMAFNQRRKTLRNSLKPLIQNDNIKNDPIFAKRPEQLSVKDFIQLTQLLKYHNEA